MHDPARHTYWFGPFAECSSVLDINGDGKLDIAAGRNYYLAPDWTKVPDYREGAATNGPDVDDNYEGTMDVNNDGRPDLYLGAHHGPPGGYGARDTVLLNSASGNFTEATPTILPPRSGGPAWGVVSVEPEDLNNDGYKDIILSVIDVAYDSGRIQLLLNNGDGTFRDGTAGIDK